MSAAPGEVRPYLDPAMLARVEGLDLRRVTPGDYDLWCLPLKVVGADGAPCRAVLSSRRKR